MKKQMKSIKEKNKAKSNYLSSSSCMIDVSKNKSRNKRRSAMHPETPDDAFIRMKDQKISYSVGNDTHRHGRGHSGHVR